MFGCSKHLTRVIRQVAKPLNYTVTVMPVGTGQSCEFDGCDKGAMWAVHPA